MIETTLRTVKTQLLQDWILQCVACGIRVPMIGVSNQISGTALFFTDLVVRKNLNRNGLGPIFSPVQNEAMKQVLFGTNFSLTAGVIILKRLITKAILVSNTFQHL